VKRKNPNTGRPFKHGDVREDGYIFFRYESKLREDGTFYEKWHSPAVFKRLKDRQTRRERIVYTGKTSINPRTQKPYRRGDINSEGLIFWSSDGYAPLDEDGYKRPIFLTRQKFEQSAQATKEHADRLFEDFDYFIHHRFLNAKRRANRKKLKFSITKEYLKSTYPSHGFCPVFGVKMEARGDGLNSASIDRIDNEKGYEEGNVR